MLFVLAVAAVVVMPGFGSVRDAAAGTPAAAGARIIRVGLACADKPTVGVAAGGGAGSQHLAINGTELPAPVQFTLEVQPDGAGALLACCGADGNVFRTGLPATVRAAGEGAQSCLLWLDSAAAVYRGEFQLCSGGGGKGLALVNVVGIEDYVAGVVPYEIGATSPPDALRAQAVIARTEAVNAGKRHAADGFDICNTTHCQVYLGAAREIATPAVREAVDATAGEVLWFGGKPASGSNYFACCGGYTESALALWKSDIAYMRTIACRPAQGGAGPVLELPRDEAMVRKAIASPCADDYCYGSTGYRWTCTVTQATLADTVSTVIGVRPAKVTAIEVLERTPRGAAVKVVVVTAERRHEIAGELAIRMALGGPVAVKSGVFVVDPGMAAGEGKPPTEFKLSGAGYGHGVGLCQYGARKMAALGIGYREILNHYYPGVSVGRLQEQAAEGAEGPAESAAPADPVTPASPEALVMPGISGTLQVPDTQEIQEAPDQGAGETYVTP